MLFPRLNVDITLGLASQGRICEVFSEEFADFVFKRAHISAWLRGNAENIPFVTPGG